MFSYQIYFFYLNLFFCFEDYLNLSAPTYAHIPVSAPTTLYVKSNAIYLLYRCFILINRRCTQKYKIIISASLYSGASVNNPLVALL